MIVESLLYRLSWWGRLKTEETRIKLIDLPNDQTVRLEYSFEKAEVRVSYKGPLMSKFEGERIYRPNEEPYNPFITPEENERQSLASKRLREGV